MGDAARSRTMGQGLRAPFLVIRRFCLECQGGSARSVRACGDSQCPLWEWRLFLQEKNGFPAVKESSRQALRAIRRQCMYCAGARGEVRSCVAREGCVLWSFRFGVRPVTYLEVRRRFFAPKPLRLL